MPFYPLERWVCFGKLDCSDPIDFDFEVTPAEFERLKHYDQAGHSLSSVPELEGLYLRALSESSELGQTELQNMLGDDEDDQTDYYDYHVNFRA